VKTRRKEIYVPSEQAAKRLQPEALDAFLDGILAELDEPADPVALDEIRAAFRKRVPFSKRSYAAAALILRAAGFSRGPAPIIKGQPKSDKAKRPSDRDADRGGKVVRSKDENRQRDRARGQEEGRQGQNGRPRFSGEGTTLFFSMGKRQRLYPRVLIDLIADVASLAPEAIGEVRAFDNYSFADIDPIKAGAVISALDGYEIKGRKLSVGPAKKRDESGASE
jgi:hypothetical protein